MYPQPERPGYGVFVHESVRAIAARGHDVLVVAPLPATPPLLDRLHAPWRALAAVPAERELDGLRVLHPRYLLLPRRVAFAGAAARMATAVLRLRARFGGVDLLHAHAGLPDGAAARRVARALGLPYLVTSHGSDVLRMTAWSPRVRAELAYGFERAAAVLFPSRVALGRAEARGLPVARARVLANGHDHALFSAAPPPADDGGPLRVIAVANHYPDKGLDRLLRAAARAAAGDVPVDLHLIGAGPESQRLRALADELGLAPRWTGSLGRRELAAALAAAQAFVLPARGESFGIAYLEAMAAGLAVVAPADEPIGEIVANGEDGILVPGGEDGDRQVAALAAALAGLAHDPDRRRRLGDAARAKAAAYGWVRHAEGLEAIYVECAAASGASGRGAG
jgi:glycosyltransferase involved in cell wall biosynthesis